MIEPPKMVIKQERMLFKLRNTGWLVNCDQRLSRNINHGMLQIVFVLKKSRLAGRRVDRSHPVMVLRPAAAGIISRWCPLDINWFINLINYRYNTYKP